MRQIKATRPSVRATWRQLAASLLRSHEESDVFVSGSFSSAVLDSFPPCAIPARFFEDGGGRFRHFAGHMALAIPLAAECPDAASTRRLSAPIARQEVPTVCSGRAWRLRVRATRSTRQRAVSASFLPPPRLRSHAELLRRLEF